MVAGSAGHLAIWPCPHSIPQYDVMPPASPNRLCECNSKSCSSSCKTRTIRLLADHAFSKCSPFLVQVVSARDNAPLKCPQAGHRGPWLVCAPLAVPAWQQGSPCTDITVCDACYGQLQACSVQADGCWAEKFQFKLPQVQALAVLEQVCVALWHCLAHLAPSARNQHTRWPPRMRA